MAALALTTAAAFACQGIDPSPPPPEIGPADRARHTRRMLEDARAFRSQGRHDAAERSLTRGLAVDPDHPELHRTLAWVLHESGREDEARAHRARADALDPPPEAVPNRPLDSSSRNVLVVLLPPDTHGLRLDRIPVGWPDHPSAEALRQRLRVRLPEARVTDGAPGTIAEAKHLIAGYHPRAVISLRLDRLWCGETRKDGRFGLAWLRAAAESPGGDARRAGVVREVVSDPRSVGGCEKETVARVLERALALPAFERALSAPPLRSGTASGAVRWSHPELRILFPGIDRNLRAELTAGERWLAHGRLDEAEESFRRAAAVDPDDRTVRTYLVEVGQTLALAREIESLRPERGRSPDGASVLDARLTSKQIAAFETQLSEEQRRRRELLGLLEVLAEDVSAPSTQTLATLRTVSAESASAFGPVEARARAGGPVEARAAYAPDGSVVARYYFPIGSEAPVLREEDTDGDGRPDRWIGYAGGVRTNIWEDGRASGTPDVHLVFAVGGSRLDRIELDADGDGRPERLFQYRDGNLVSESRDTDRDGDFDRFDRLDDNGRVSVREEDRDGNGSIDVRTHYRDGKLDRREFLDPALAPDAL